MRAGFNRRKLRSMLSEVYTDEGAAIWMNRPHPRWSGLTVPEMVARGRGDEVMRAAESLLGQVAT
jgi:hypothetical protein